MLSTFAAAHLGKMTPAQLAEYDRFLDENDWDIYYWATQSPTTTPEGAAAAAAAPEKDTPTESWQRTGARSGEWSQTHGAFKPAHRPVPSRWECSEILQMIRDHVQARSAHGGTKSGGGLGRMPTIDVFQS